MTMPAESADGARWASYPDRRWKHQSIVALRYATSRLARHEVDPSGFGVVWANMERGFRKGELRTLPTLAEAFDDWLHEALAGH